jgi:hypothetical protein
MDKGIRFPLQFWTCVDQKQTKMSNVKVPSASNQGQAMAHSGTTFVMCALFQTNHVSPASHLAR